MQLHVTVIGLMQLTSSITSFDFTHMSYNIQHRMPQTFIIFAICSDTVNCH